MFGSLCSDPVLGFTGFHWFLGLSLNDARSTTGRIFEMTVSVYLLLVFPFYVRLVQCTVVKLYYYVLLLGTQTWLPNGTELNVASWRCWHTAFILFIVSLYHCGSLACHIFLVLSSAYFMQFAHASDFFGASRNSFQDEVASP